MKKQTFSILFFQKKGRVTQKGVSPVMMRIILNGVRSELSIQRKINPNLWNQKLEKATGKDIVSIELNKYIESLKGRIYQILRGFEDNNIPYDIEAIKRHLRGEDIEKPKMFCEIFQEHNDRYEKLAGIDITDITYKRYVRTLEYFKEFYIPKYKENDLPIEKLNRDIIEGFEVFLKTEKGCAQNSTNRHLKYVKKMTNFAKENGWIKHNPFSGKILSEKEAEVTFLTLAEIETIFKKEFEIERLERVRDVFVFCCYTGLAFVDMENLKMEHIYEDENGGFWIHNKRIKTGTNFNVPLLDIPLKLIKKYENHSCRIKDGLVLPVMSNQNMNAYLKEIADVCKIKKRIVTHTGRHSFATSIALANDVSIQNVSKMLGHKDLKITQHYAKVLDSSVMSQMQNVNSKLNSREAI